MGNADETAITVARKGKYKGWETGGYLYSDETKSLMSKEEEQQYIDQFKKWQKDLASRRARDEHTTSFIGVDGIEYQLAPGLEGILEIEDSPVKACKRYSEGKVTWEVLKAFLVYFPYAKPSPTYALLTEEGNIYPDGGRSHPREFNCLGLASSMRYISTEQYLEIVQANEILRGSIRDANGHANKAQT